jgi:hypothetical protein
MKKQNKKQQQNINNAITDESVKQYFPFRVTDNVDTTFWKRRFRLQEGKRTFVTTADLGSYRRSDANVVIVFWKIVDARFFLRSFGGSYIF